MICPDGLVTGSNTLRSEELIKHLLWSFLESFGHAAGTDHSLFSFEMSAHSFRMPYELFSDFQGHRTLNLIIESVNKSNEV